MKLMIQGGGKREDETMKSALDTINKVWNLFKVINKDTSTTSLWCFIYRLKHISHLYVNFLMLGWCKYLSAGKIKSCFLLLFLLFCL